MNTAFSELLDSQAYIISPSDRRSIAIIQAALREKLDVQSARDAADAVSALGVPSTSTKSVGTNLGGGGGGRGTDASKALTDFTKTILTAKQLEGISNATVRGQLGVKDIIQRNIVLPLTYPHVFGAQPRGVMMYGPGGTGKSLFAKLIAVNTGRPTFVVAGSDIMSMWFGNAEKNMAKLIATALDKAKGDPGGAVIFFDEADTLLGAEGENTRPIVTEFKTRYDALKAENIVIIVATNDPSAFHDSGVVRRMGLPIYVGLPSHDDMYDLVDHFIREKTAACHRSNLPAELLSASEWERIYPRIAIFAPDNVRNLIAAADAFATPGKYEVKELHFCKTTLADGTVQVSAHAAEHHAQCVTIDQLTPEEQAAICWPRISAAALEKALDARTVSPSTTWQNMLAYAKYARDKPDERGLQCICADFAKFARYDQAEHARDPSHKLHNYDEAPAFKELGCPANAACPVPPSPTPAQPQPQPQQPQPQTQPPPTTTTTNVPAEPAPTETPPVVPPTEPVVEPEPEPEPTGWFGGLFDSKYRMI